MLRQLAEKMLQLGCVDQTYASASSKHLQEAAAQGTSGLFVPGELSRRKLELAAASEVAVRAACHMR